MAELHKPRLFAQLENLREQSRKRLQVPLAEVGDGAKIRRIEPDNAQEVDPFARRRGDPARRVDPIAIAVEQQPRHHRRVKLRMPGSLAYAGSSTATSLQYVEHRSKMNVAQPPLDKVLHARRQQQRLIDRPGPEGLAHKQAESDFRANAATKIRYFSDRLLADAILWPRVDDEDNLLMTFTGGKGELTPFHKELLEGRSTSESGLYI